MAKNYLASLSEETADHSNDGIRKPNNGSLRLGKKYPQTVRIIPYVDRQFWFPYRQCWVELYNKKHTKTFPTMLTFSFKDDGTDKLRTLISNIISTNYKYRKDNPSFKKDIIPLQFPHAGHPNFYASLRPMFALQAIKIVTGANGDNVENTFSGSSLPMPQIMNVPKTVMSTIRDSIMSSNKQQLATYADKNTGKPYKLTVTDPTKMRWINTGKTFAVYIHLDKNNTYHVEPQVFTQYPPLPKELYAKDSKGNYKHLDDPKYIYEPTKTRQPSIYQMAYDQLSKRYDQYKEGNHNPFKDQLKTVKNNVKGSGDDTIIAGQSDSSESSKPKSSGFNPFASQEAPKSSSSVDVDNIVNNTVVGTHSSNSTSSNSNGNGNNGVSSSASSSSTSSSVSQQSSNTNPSSESDTKSSDSNDEKKSSGKSVDLSKLNLSDFSPKARKAIKNALK